MPSREDTGVQATSCDPRRGEGIPGLRPAGNPSVNGSHGVDKLGRP
jgi:hypothetical protein